MIKKIFVAIALLAISHSYAQQGSVSPYSFFGTGDVQFKGLMENRMMGGISVYTDSIHLNLQNPASLGSLMRTTFTTALTHKRVNLKTDQQSETLKDYSFDYLALGFPITKGVGMNFGVLPYSSVGYNLQELDTLSDPSRLSRFSGDGGLNKVFAGVGFTPFRNFSIGATANFNFGSVEHRNSEFIQDVQYGSRELNRSEYSGFDFNLAATYHGMITKKLELFSSVMYTPQAEIGSSNFREISTIFVGADGNEGAVDTEEVDLGALGLKSTDLTIPESYTLGLGVGRPLQWFVGAEYQFKKTSEYGNPFFELTNGNYEDAERYSFGAFWIPDYDSFTSYFKRVTYRVGLRNERTGLVVNNVPLHDFGMTFGMGLPLGNFSNANVGFEYGKRGTTFQGRVQENYFNVFISLSLSDRWFRKVLIN